MGANTAIEWTDCTWNPWHGCHKVSQGCKNCYMFRDKKRYGQDPNAVTRSKTKFSDPLKWPRVPMLCFTCSWSDWFIEEADTWRDEAYEIIRATPHITYQILTKRIERAPGRVPDPVLPNIWFGVSIEDQKTADERIPQLLRLSAAKRFVSYEPALGPVGLFSYLPCSHEPGGCDLCREWEVTHGLDWVICGGESGPEARAMHPDWARSVRDQCVAAQVPFFFKQWGETLPAMQDGALVKGIQVMNASDEPQRIGKKKAGALLDDQEWRQFPV